LALATLVFLGVALRLPFLHAPLTADEGGYAEVARLWSHGHRLYYGVWVDRPQGLLLVFRGALGLGITSAAGLRTVAIGFGVLLVLLAALLGTLSGGRDRGLIVAALVATAGASPLLESFTLSGELVASVAAAAAIVAYIRYAATGRLAWLVCSGVCGGSAWMMKQSALDAALAVGFCLAIGRGRWTHLAPFVGAVAAPVVAGVVLSGNPQAWYDAVVGYGLHASGKGMTLLDRWRLLERSFPAAAESLGPVAVLAAIGFRRASVLARAWLAAGVVGVLVGGSFHAHYYLQLVVPLAFVASFVPWSRWSARAAIAAAAAVTISFAAPLWDATADAQARSIWPTDIHLQSDVEVAAFVRAHTRPSEKIYVLWAAADLYYLADRSPALPYLWYRNLEAINGAVTNVERLLDRRGAALVIEEQAPSKLDPSGAVAAALRRNYRLGARVAGVDIYER
jgi:hypothetical protein